MSTLLSSIDDLIKGHEHARRLYLFHSSLVAAVGVSLVILSFLLPASSIMIGTHAPSLQIGGAFISFLSTFPMKEFLARGDKILALKSIRSRAEKAIHDGRRSKELRTLEQYVLDLYAKVITNG